MSQAAGARAVGKTVIIIGDGMSDYPVARLGGQTPLQAAHKPHIDRIAAEGRLGLFRTIEPGLPMGSDVANLAVLGYDPAKLLQGRAVLEAASMGVALRPEDVAVRCNLIHVDAGAIVNHSAGHIPSEQAAPIIAALDRALGGGQGSRPVRFYPGVSYRHLLVLEGGWADPAVALAPPHDHVGERVADLLPAARPGAGPAAEATAARLRELFTASQELLARHPINAERQAAGQDTANAIWTWSPGRRPSMATFQERFGVRGAVISAVDLIQGLGIYAGMDVIKVPGATGLSDTNYEGKAQAALDALADHDLVYVHVEATDEAGHSRDLALKVRCIEYLDQRLVGPLLAGLEQRGLQAAVAVLPDHPTPVESGKHADDPVPVAIRRPDWTPDGAAGYDEAQAARGSLGLLRGERFIRLALGLPA